jgi:hypothetical protein
MLLLLSTPAMGRPLQEPPAAGEPADTPAARRRAEARAMRAGRVPTPPNPETMTVQQVEQYFDQVVLHQARLNLQLNDDQFLRFGAGLRRLQTARRQLQRQRVALVRDLGTLLNATPFDEAATTVKLKALDDFTTRSNEEVRTAYSAIDAVLDLRQRARFRIFEEMMERRKLDLLARARQLSGRQAAPRP